MSDDSDAWEDLFSSFGMIVRKNSVLRIVVTLVEYEDNRYLSRVFGMMFTYYKTKTESTTNYALSIHVRIFHISGEDNQFHPRLRRSRHDLGERK
jgi:hypothetical protein